MDQTLIDLLKQDRNSKGDVDTNIRILDGRTGEIEFGSQGRVTKYMLKPLADLYGPGRGFSSVDPLNPEYEELMNGIEHSILEYYDTDDGLTDGLVSLVVDRMGVNPACDPHDDELCRCLQFDMRMLLSLNNYSKQEVRQAFRVVSKSVQRHTKMAGITGYLEFIQRHLKL